MTYEGNLSRRETTIGWNVIESPKNKALHIANYRGFSFRRFFIVIENSRKSKSRSRSNPDTLLLATAGGKIIDCGRNRRGCDIGVKPKLKSLLLEQPCLIHQAFKIDNGG
jgi:hypothetical protein